LSERRKKAPDHIFWGRRKRWRLQGGGRGNPFIYYVVETGLFLRRKSPRSSRRGFPAISKKMREDAERERENRGFQAKIGKGPISLFFEKRTLLAGKKKGGRETALRRRGSDKKALLLTPKQQSQKGG